MPEPLKLFISYRSSDAPKVDKIARDLALLKHEDGTPRYVPWQDKHNLPPASPHWWDAIVYAIEDCQAFIFHISQDSLKSVVCHAELDYAHRRNRPIIPVVLEGEFFLDPVSGKYNLTKEIWDLIPPWLGERQFLFYGADFFRQFEMAMDVFRRAWPRDVYAPRPMDPTPNTNQTRNYALYDQACDFAERLAFAEAEKLFDVLVRRNDREFGAAAAEWLELLRRYNELIEMDALPRLRFHFKSRWLEYRSLFPKDFLDEMFDPKGLAGKTNGSPDDEEDITATNSDVDLKIADYAALFPENILQEVLDPKEFTNTISASPDDTEGMTVEESLERSKSQPNRGVELKVADYTDSTPLTLVLAEEYYNSGNNYYMKHKYNQAITDYTDAIQLKVVVTH